MEEDFLEDDNVYEVIDLYVPRADYSSQKNYLRGFVF